MSKAKNKVRTFQDMRYRKVQRKNSRNRNLLANEQQQWLKEHSYKNVGWNNVISLFEKIREIQRQEEIKSLSLEELFLEADRIGNRYLDSQEVNKRNLAIAKEIDQISNSFNEQFPDDTVEIIDYAKTSKRKS